MFFLRSHVCYIVNIKVYANICCTREQRWNHVSKVYFIVKKHKNAAKTLRQNQTELILLQCFCSIFLLEKLTLLQCLMGGPRAVSYIYAQRSVWITNSTRGSELKKQGCRAVFRTLPNMYDGVFPRKYNG